MSKESIDIFTGSQKQKQKQEQEDKVGTVE